MKPAPIVVHSPRFGRGVLLELESPGPHARVKVAFDDHSRPKWLVVAYAQLRTEHGLWLSPGPWGAAA